MSNSLTPPGTVTRVSATRVLVLAPHQDDELLGCGGLLQSLLEDGALVTVLFLTDGSGGVEADGADGPELGYAEIRQQEAEAVAAMAGWDTEQLEFRDGLLRQNVAALATALAEKMTALAPDLVLVPGPLELTPDHVATFQALFETLTPLRVGDALFERAAACRFLTYSVNHPGYPNLLVDVSERLSWLTEAMGLYQSQLARHNYIEAGLGLRQFRAHSLGAEVIAAEGYSELRLNDFTTHSLTSLSEQLGAPARRTSSEDPVAVSLIVRTFNRPQFLHQALVSVADNTRLPAEVVLVNDGGTNPSEDAKVAELLRDFPVPIQHVNLSSNRGRAAAANAGLAAARSEFIAFLDDDDVLFPEHFQILSGAVAAAEVKVAYSDAAVATYRLEGSEQFDGRDGGGWTCVQRGLPYSRDFDPVRILVDNYIPFHTLIIERELAQAVGFDEELAAFEDWDFIIRLAQQSSPHHLRRTTCEYRHYLGAGHHALGDVRDTSQEFTLNKARVISKHSALLTPETLARAVSDLRRETVEQQQEVAELHVRWESDRQGRSEAAHEASRLRELLSERDTQLLLANDRYHREHGEVEALRAEDQRLRAEAGGLSARIQELDKERDAIADQQAQAADQQAQTAEHLGRTYAEIERLMALIEEMKGTRAWRLHELLHRKPKG